MENAAVELHDSTVVAIDLVAGAVVVQLMAYVHRSAGRPGYDSGSGWVQAVELSFTGGAIKERPAELPCELSDGSVLDGVTFDHLISLPASVGSFVRFEAVGQDGERLTIWGEGLEVVAVAEGRFVELFPGT